MHSSTICSPVDTGPDSSGVPREHARGRSATLRARALEIVGILYRCERDAAVQLLTRHSQDNNLRVAALAEALVTVVDGASDHPDGGAQTTLATHFWLREIRRLGRTHRRSDRWVRHVATAGGCVGASRNEAWRSSVRQSDPNRVDFSTQV